MRHVSDLDSARIYRVFDMLDVDGSGEIDFDEFYLLMCILIAVKVTRSSLLNIIIYNEHVRAWFHSKFLCAILLNKPDVSIKSFCVCFIIFKTLQAFQVLHKEKIEKNELLRKKELV